MYTAFINVIICSQSVLLIFITSMRVRPGYRGRCCDYAKDWATEESWFDFSKGQDFFFPFFRGDQTDSGVHGSVFTGYRGSLPGDKAAGSCSADHSAPSNDEVKKSWSSTSIPSYAFMTRTVNYKFYLYDSRAYDT